MGKITGTNGDVTRTFTCEQYALMGYSLPAGWTMTGNTCGIYMELIHSPFASYGLDLTGGALPGNWYVYEGVVADDRVIIPTDAFTLPSNWNNVFVIVRRQQYHPDVPGDVRDFFVNNADNSIDFRTTLGLNGQTAYVRIFK